MKILNTKLGRQAIAAALVLSAASALCFGAFAEAPAAETTTDDAVIAGYLPPQDESIMIQGDIALHSGDVAVGEKDPNYGGYASPVENPIQGNIMLISELPTDAAPTSSKLTTTLPSDTLVEKSEARYTVKGFLGKQVLYTARQEGRVLTLAVPEDTATFRTTILDMQTLLNQGVSTVVLTTNKTSTTLNLTLLCEGQKANTKVTLRHIGDSATLTVGLRCRRDLIVGR